MVVVVVVVGVVGVVVVVAVVKMWLCGCVVVPITTMTIPISSPPAASILATPPQAGTLQVGFLRAKGKPPTHSL